jgi:hypothetical protein
MNLTRLLAAFIVMPFDITVALTTNNCMPAECPKPLRFVFLLNEDEFACVTPALEIIWFSTVLNKTQRRAGAIDDVAAYSRCNALPVFGTINFQWFGW